MLIVAALVPSVLYRNYTRQHLAECENLLDALPLAEKRAHSAEQLLKAVTPTFALAPDATQDATRRLDEAATRAGLTLRALKVVEGAEDKNGFKSITLQVQTQGSLRSLVQWLDEIQRPGLLLGITSVAFNGLAPLSEGIYSADLRIALRLRTS